MINKISKWQRSQVTGAIGAKVVDGDLNTALKVFSREVKSSGILKEVYKRKEFIKPSDSRRLVREKAVYANSIKSKL